MAVVPASSFPQMTKPLNYGRSISAANSTSFPESLSPQPLPPNPAIQVYEKSIKHVSNFNCQPSQPASNSTPPSLLAGASTGPAAVIGLRGSFPRSSSSGSLVSVKTASSEISANLQFPSGGLPDIHLPKVCLPSFPVHLHSLHLPAFHSCCPLLLR